MLRKFYDELENKTPFVNEVCYRTGRSEATVRNWIKYGMKPSDSKDVSVLVEITGIPAENLWKDE